MTRKQPEILMRLV